MIDFNSTFQGLLEGTKTAKARRFRRAVWRQADQMSQVHRGAEQSNKKFLRHKPSGMYVHKDQSVSDDAYLIPDTGHARKFNPSELEPVDQSVKLRHAMRANRGIIRRDSWPGVNYNMRTTRS